MLQHNYINPAFCQTSEFYPVRSATSSNQGDQCNVNPNNKYTLSLDTKVSSSAYRNFLDSPLGFQQNMSKNTSRPIADKISKLGKPLQIPSSKQIINMSQTQNDYQNRYCNSLVGNIFDSRYALVPVEELLSGKNNCYTIVPSISIPAKHCFKSQENLKHYRDEEFQFSNLPPVFDSLEKNSLSAPPVPLISKEIKHAFSSDFGSKSFLFVDKNSNQGYQMIPTAENEELVDENQEIIQMHNGRAHRYAVIPTEIKDKKGEEETCLTASDINDSQHFLAINCGSTHRSLLTSTPQETISMSNLFFYPNPPAKNEASKKILNELLHTSPKTHESRKAEIQGYVVNGRSDISSSRIYESTRCKKKRSPKRLQYEIVEPSFSSVQHTDRTTAIISPRVAGSNICPLVDESSCREDRNNSYPQKVVNATITLAVVSLMLVFCSTMNSCLIIYMIAHLGKSYYLQFSLVAAFCGVGLGFLGFRARHCHWLPNRSYTSGFILVTMFSLLKCSGLLVILVLDPYPGLPIHDVTTGVIFGLSTFITFFIGLGVIGSLWCYRTPPDNRINVV